MADLESLTSPEGVAGRARFGIRAEHSLGIPIPVLRAMGKRLGRDQAFAQELWDTGIHDARLLASLVGDPRVITAATMDAWTSDFQTWDLCDACCGNLFDRTPFAWRKPYEWAPRPEEFVRRAAFSLIAFLAVHDKKASDQRFLEFLPLIFEAAPDGRNFVKKAVDWALRSIGKRNRVLHVEALRAAHALRASPEAASRWIASRTIRELEGRTFR